MVWCVLLQCGDISSAILSLLNPLVILFISLAFRQASWLTLHLVALRKRTWLRCRISKQNWNSWNKGKKWIWIFHSISNVCKIAGGEQFWRMVNVLKLYHYVSTDAVWLAWYPQHLLMYFSCPAFLLLDAMEFWYSCFLEHHFSALYTIEDCCSGQRHLISCLSLR